MTTLYNSNYDYVNYFVQDMEKQQSMKGKISSTKRLYTSIQSVKWLLALNITAVRTLQKGSQGIASQVFNTKDGDEFSAKCLCKK